MAPPQTTRADARRNRERIIDAARAAFAQPGAPVSMAEVARRAGVGMATLYRNFAGRRELLEALYTQEVDAVCAAATAHADAAGDAAQTGEAFTRWLGEFFDYFTAKRPIAIGLLEHTDRGDPVFDRMRDRVLVAARPLLLAAQRSGDVRADLTLEQILDMVTAVAAIPGDADYLRPILRATLDGIGAYTPRP